MTNYNSLGELSVFILSLVLLFNVIGSSSRKGRAHKYFELNCILLTASTFTNIISVLCIENWQSLPHSFCTTVTTIYFYLLMASPFALAFYGYMFMSLRKRHFRAAMYFLFTPLTISFIITILSNINHKLLSSHIVHFSITPPFINIIWHLCLIYK